MGEEKDEDWRKEEKKDRKGRGEVHDGQQTVAQDKMEKARVRDEEDSRHQPQSLIIKVLFIYLFYDSDQTV